MGMYRMLIGEIKDGFEDDKDRLYILDIQPKKLKL